MSVGKDAACRARFDSSGLLASGLGIMDQGIEWSREVHATESDFTFQGLRLRVYRTSSGCRDPTGCEV